MISVNIARGQCRWHLARYVFALTGKCAFAVCQQ
jgi:hypothetical protein